MRVKSDARRDAILAVATELFREEGYERASMAQIAARVGGSKATLYNYFGSKEAIFAASMLEAVEEQGQSVIDLLDPSNDDVASVLCRFGEAYLRLLVTPDTLAITRTAISEGSNSGLGAKLYERGPKRAWNEVASYIGQLQDRGCLRGASPHLVAAHFKGMLEADYLEPLLWGASPSHQDPAAAARDAVAALVKAYAADQLSS